MKSDEGEREEMRPIERSEAFWDTFGTVTSESKVDKSDNSKSDVYTSVEGTGGNVDDNDDEEDDNDQSSKRSKRRRGRVYSRFGRMEIWDCSILGCESRLRRCSVIAELDFFPLFFANSIFLSLRSRFDERTYVRMRIHIRVSSFFILFSLSLSFPLPSLDHSSLYMMRPTRVYLTPRTTNEESSRARKPLLVLGPPLLLLLLLRRSLHPATTCETS